MMDAERITKHSIASPVGIITITGSEDYLTGISFHGKTAVPETITSILPEPLRACISFLEEYFSGSRIPDPSRMKRYLYLDDFTESGKGILLALMSVHAGSVISYGELARKSGLPGAARFAGSMMARNPFAILVPCHRVITSSGAVGNYSGGVHIKEWLLRHEGVIIDNGRIRTD